MKHAIGISYVHIMGEVSRANALEVIDYEISSGRSIEQINRDLFAFIASDYEDFETFMISGGRSKKFTIGDVLNAIKPLPVCDGPKISITSAVGIYMCKIGIAPNEAQQYEWPR